MSSGLAKRSTSRISKSIPFSNSTKRQRCEYGSVVPEYSTIMAGAPSKKQVVKKQSTGKPVGRTSRAVGNRRYFTSFQYDAFSRQQISQKPVRKINTQTPSL